MHDVITLFLAGFVLALGGMLAYWCVKTLIDTALEVKDEIELWLWRRKQKKQGQ